MTLRPSREEALLALAGLAWEVAWLARQPLAAVLIGALTATGMLISRRCPRVAAGLVLGGCLLAAALGVPAENPATLFPVAVATYGLGRWCGPRAAVVGLLAFLAAAGWADGLAVPTLVFSTFLYACFWAFGRLVAGKTARADEARQRAVRVGEQDPAVVAAAVVAEERARLAADIAHVVGEAVRAMVADAELAERSLDPEVIERVRRRGTAAVTELRRMLGLFRQEPERDIPGLSPSSVGRSWRRYVPTAAVLLLGMSGLLLVDPRPPAAVLVLLGLLPLVLLLRTNRLLVALLATAASLGLVGLVQPTPVGVGVVLVLMLLSWSVGVDGRRSVWLAWLAVAGVSALEALLADPDNAALQVVLTVLPAWAGHAWSESDREQRSAQATTAKVQSDIDRAVAEAVRRERLRVARDLHDVTSHALGVMVLQAGAAAAQRVEDPVRARMSLAVIRDTGSRALADLVRLVGLIDAGALGVVAEGEPADLAERLEALAERIRHSGVEVGLDVHRLPNDPAASQACFRVVQKALTNAVRHAPGCSVQVVIDGSDGGTRISVVDDGGCPSEASDACGAGFGLVGAAERVRALDGEFSAGPDGRGGWSVRADLPGRTGASRGTAGAAR